LENEQPAVIAHNLKIILQQKHTGVIVWASQNRSLNSDSKRLWSKLEAQPISLEQEIELPQTSQRPAHQTKLGI
jgi:hypothetical protein